MNQLLIIFHLLGATIWVGGHLILCVRFLPKAIKEENAQVIIDFETQYETIGIPALLIQIITGIMLSYQYGVEWRDWFSFMGGVETVVSIKLILLVFTMILAAHARIFIIPKLSTKNLNFMAMHIVAITLTAIGMLVIGTFVRMGGM